MGDVVLERLDDQISWYDDRSRRNQRRFKLLKYVEIVAAALIPILASFSGVPQWVAAILGGVVVVCEAVLHLNKYQENWLTYRSTAEALKHTRPASVFSRSTEAHNQDKVSMGTIAARDCLRVLELTEQVAAAHTLAPVQALNLRLRLDPSTRSRRSRRSSPKTARWKASCAH